MAGKRKKPEGEPVVEYVVVFKDDSGEYRWTARAGNNKNVATSGEGYRNRAYTIKMAKALYGSVPVIVQ